MERQTDLTSEEIETYEDGQGWQLALIDQNLNSIVEPSIPLNDGNM